MEDITTRSSMEPLCFTRVVSQHNFLAIRLVASGGSVMMAIFTEMDN